jgi:hypothetical protein
MGSIGSASWFAFPFRARLPRSRGRVSLPLVGVLLLSTAAMAPARPTTPLPVSRTSEPAGRGEVTIPVSEYRRLIDSAGSDGSGGSVLPGARVDNARFRIAVSGGAAFFEEQFDVHVAGTGWLSLPVARGALDQASIAPPERGAFFVAREWTRLAIAGPGSAAATVGTTAHVGTDANGRQFFSLTMPLLAVQEGRIELPGAGLEVTVSGGELLGRNERNGATILEVAVRPGATLSVAFREQNLAERGRSAALRASATLYSRTDVVGPNVVTDVSVRIVAAAGRIGGVAFEVPVGWQVLYLRGNGLLAAETSGGQVKASRVAPSPDPLEAQLRLTRPLAEGTPVEIAPPKLVLEGDGPVDAYAELRPPPGVLVEMTAPGSFEPVEIDKVPPSLRPLAADSEEVLHLAAGQSDHPNPAVYVLHRLDAAPVLVAQVRAARGHTLVSSNGRALSRIEYEVVSSAKPFLTVHLTPGSHFWGAEAMGRPILPAMPETGSVAIPLRGGRRRVARVAIYVLSDSVPAPRGRGKRTLEFQPPGTDIPISTLTWTFSLPSGAAYRLAGTD